MTLATALAFVLGLLSAKLCKGDDSVANIQKYLISRPKRLILNIYYNSPSVPMK